MEGGEKNSGYMDHGGGKEGKTGKEVREEGDTEGKM